MIYVHQCFQVIHQHHRPSVVHGREFNSIYRHNRLRHCYFWHYDGTDHGTVVFAMNDGMHRAVVGGYRPRPMELAIGFNEDTVEYH